jgi:hypothetical protein
MSGEGAFISLTKGPVHAAIEACVNDPDNGYAKRQNLLQALQDLPEDEERIADFVFIIKQIAQVTEAAAQYLDTHWFRWWSEKRFQEPILRLGIIRAINVANSDRENILPIEFLWLNIGQRTLQGNPVPSELYPFETYVIRSLQQVTCLLVTPPSPRPTSQEYLDALVEGDNFWLVKDSAGSALEFGETLERNHSKGLRTTRLKVLSPEHDLQSRTVKRQARVRAPRRP